MGFLPKEICGIIWDYDPIYQLDDWIQQDKLSNEYLYKNEHATRIIEHTYSTNSHDARLNWYYVCKDENLSYIVEEIYSANPHDDRLQWDAISTNKELSHIIEKLYYNDPHDKRIYYEQIYKNDNLSNMIEHIYNTYGDNNNDLWLASRWRKSRGTYNNYVSYNIIYWCHVCHNSKYSELLKKIFKENPFDDRLNYYIIAENDENHEIIREMYSLNRHRLSYNIFGNKHLHGIIRNTYIRYKMIICKPHLLRYNNIQDIVSDYFNKYLLDYRAFVKLYKLHHKGDYEKIYAIYNKHWKWISMNHHYLHLIKTAYLSGREIKWDYLSANKGIFIKTLAPLSELEW